MRGFRESCASHLRVSQIACGRLGRRSSVGFARPDPVAFGRKARLLHPGRPRRRTIGMSATAKAAPAPGTKFAS